MSMLTANLLCVALVITDLVARAWRIQWLLHGTQCRISLPRCAGGERAWATSAAAVTPNRIGGEPARLGGEVLSKVPVAAGVVAIAIETLVMWPVNILVGLWLAVRYAPEWWHTAGPGAGGHGGRRVALAARRCSSRARSRGGWCAATRRRSRTRCGAGRGGRGCTRGGCRVGRSWPARSRRWSRVVARVAILPVLALTLPHPPPIGPLAFASFALHLRAAAPADAVGGRAWWSSDSSAARWGTSARATRRCCCSGASTRRSC